MPVWMQADSEIAETAGKYFFILYTPMLLRAASIIFGTALRAAGDTRTPMRVSLLMNEVTDYALGEENFYLYKMYHASRSAEEDINKLT